MARVRELGPEGRIAQPKLHLLAHNCIRFPYIDPCFCRFVRGPASGEDMAEPGEVNLLSKFQQRKIVLLSFPIVFWVRYDSV